MPAFAVMAKAILSDVISYYHLVSGLSFCLAKGDIDFVEVQLLPNLNDEFLLGECEFVIRDIEVTVRHSPKFAGPWAEKFICYSFRRWLGSSDRPALYLGHQTYFKPTAMRNVGRIPLRALSTFTFEEGIGTYGGLKHHIRAAKRERRRFPILKYWGRKLLATKAWNDHKWGVLADDSEQTRHAYLAAIAGLSRTVYRDRVAELAEIKESAGERLVLFFSTPLVELFGLAPDDYVRLLKRISESLAAEDFNMMIKPHPLERTISLLREAGVPVIDSRLPGELVIHELSPSVVAGFNSTALLTARLLFDIRSISFGSYLAEKQAVAAALDGGLKGLFDKFVTQAK